MSESSPEQPNTPESFVDMRDSALEWIDRVGRDTELDQLVITPEGGQVWQKSIAKHLAAVPPEQHEESFKQWRLLHQRKINRDPGVRAKNLFLASVANEVEEASSTNGAYLRALFTDFNNYARLAEDAQAVRRAQFMGLWAVRKINTDFSS